MNDDASSNCHDPIVFHLYCRRGASATSRSQKLCCRAPRRASSRITAPVCNGLLPPRTRAYLITLKSQPGKYNLHGCITSVDSQKYFATQQCHEFNSQIKCTDLSTTHKQQYSNGSQFILFVPFGFFAHRFEKFRNSCSRRTHRHL